MHGVGDTWAEVTEGSDEFGGIWAREKYEWDTPGLVRGTVVDSNIFASGIWELRIEPREGGGSRLSVVNDRQPKGKGKVLGVVMSLVGARLLAGALRKTAAVVETGTE